MNGELKNVLYFFSLDYYSNFLKCSHNYYVALNVPKKRKPSQMVKDIFEPKPLKIHPGLDKKINSLNLPSLLTTRRPDSNRVDLAFSNCQAGFF
jgi:hypothetical protein